MFSDKKLRFVICNMIGQKALTKRLNHVDVNFILNSVDALFTILQLLDRKPCSYFYIQVLRIRRRNYGTELKNGLQKYREETFLSRRYLLKYGCCHNSSLILSGEEPAYSWQEGIRIKYRATVEASGQCCESESGSGHILNFFSDWADPDPE
jgi:hypothetical protein